MWALETGDRPWHRLVCVQRQRPAVSSSLTEWQVKFIPVVFLREIAIDIHQAVRKLGSHCRCVCYVLETANLNPG